MTMPEWISVKDQMPELPDRMNDEPYTPVLVTYLSYHDKVTPLTGDELAVWDGKRWRWWNSSYGEIPEDITYMHPVKVEITHWMPLPSPAKGA